MRMLLQQGIFLSKNSQVSSLSDSEKTCVDIICCSYSCHMEPEDEEFGSLEVSTGACILDAYVEYGHTFTSC